MVAGGLLGALAVSLLVTACGGGAERGTREPAIVEQVEGKNVMRVTLTPEAAKRLGVQTVAVRSAGKSADRTVIPYAAVLYDPNGDTWTYTSPRPLVFSARTSASPESTGIPQCSLPGRPPAPRS